VPANVSKPAEKFQHPRAPSFTGYTSRDGDASDYPETEAPETRCTASGRPAACRRHPRVAGATPTTQTLPRRRRPNGIRLACR